MKKCGAKQLLIVHHDPRHTDDFLSKWEKELQERDPRVQFAREGMEIVTGTD